jgi:hypothetical protein
MKKTMRKFRFPLLALGLALGVCPMTGRSQTKATQPAQQPPSSKPATTSPEKNPARPAVIYRPAAGVAVGARLTGGSRGTGEAAVRLDVLAPDETGLTTQEQPSLFWYQSKPAKASFELTLLEEDSVKPILQVKSEQSVQAGIQRLKLADHGVRLTPGVEYRWVVALITDPGNRSSDLIASGFLKRIEPSNDLQARLAKASPVEKPGIYAEAGIWHDALASLSDLIDSRPEAQNLREERADLLRQVGLQFAANADSGRKN